MKMNLIFILTFFINTSRTSKSNTPKIMFHQLGDAFRVSPIHGQSLDQTISDRIEPKETPSSTEVIDGLRTLEKFMNEHTETWMIVIESVAEQKSKIFSNLKLMFYQDHGNH